MGYNDKAVDDDRKTNEPLAQLAEHLTFNQGARGSNPRWLTKRIASHFAERFFYSQKPHFFLHLFEKKLCFPILLKNKCVVIFLVIY